jgi:hypothetical protein
MRFQIQDLERKPKCPDSVRSGSWGCLTVSGLFTCVRINWYLVVKKTEKKVPDLALNGIAFIQGDFIFTTGTGTSLPVHLLSSQLLTFSDDMVIRG